MALFSPRTPLHAIASGAAGFDLERRVRGQRVRRAFAGRLQSSRGFCCPQFALTFMFLIVILGSTDKRAAVGFAPIPIGLVLTV